MALPPVVKLLEVMAVYGEAGSGLLASGLAFSALFAALSGLMLIVSLSGFVLHDAAMRERFASDITKSIPPLAPIVSHGLETLARNAGAFSVVAIAGLAWGASQFYGALDAAFARIFRRARERDQVTRIIRGFVALGIVVLSITVGVVVAAALPHLTERAGRGPIGDLLRVASALVALVLAVAPVFLAAVAIYRLVPNMSVPWSALLPPAFAAGTAIAILTEGFVVLAPQLVGGLSVFGSFAAVFAALIWLSWSFQALLLGACWTSMRVTSALNPYGPRRDELT